MGKRLWIVLGLGVLAWIGTRGDNGGPSSTKTVSVAEQQRAAALDEFFAPPVSQRSFVSIIKDARSSFQSAANEMAQGGTRNARKNELCRTFQNGKVQGWTGKISDLSSNSDGKGVLAIEIGADVWVTTWNNAVSDTSDKTLIDPNGALFSKLAALKEGDRIKFDGALVKGRSDPDCFSEQSLTQDGAMTEPEFVFRFADVTAGPTL